MYIPTIEDAIEISGIETLHPGGFLLTRRTGEIAGLMKGMKILDVSSGRGTQSIYYAREFSVDVTGIDISEDMVRTARQKAAEENLQERVRFHHGDSQSLPFADGSFDAVINECAVGIPDDSQKVLDEMLRVVRKGGTVVIHESTWKKKLPDTEKEEIAERYGTTPLDLSEWRNMLERAGAINVYTEFEEWSKPEMFWKIRKDRHVRHWFFIMSIPEKIRTMFRIFSRYGIRGIINILKNENVFFKSVLHGKLGYALYKGVK